MPPAAGLRPNPAPLRDQGEGHQGRRPPPSAPEGCRAVHRGTRRESVPCAPVDGPAGWNPRREEITTSSPARQGADRRSRRSLTSSLIRTRPTGSSASTRPPAPAGQHRSGPARIIESGIGKSAGEPSCGEQNPQGAPWRWPGNFLCSAGRSRRHVTVQRPARPDACLRTGCSHLHLTRINWSSSCCCRGPGGGSSPRRGTRHLCGRTTAR